MPEALLPGEPVLVVLLYSSLAAALAALGSLPFLGDSYPRKIWVGGAYALASGLMLGAGYLLMARGLDLATLAVVVGAGGGVLYTYGVQAYAQVGELDRQPGDESRPEFGYKILLQDTLHSATEGVAIGVAMVLDVRLGVFMALALAVHNIAEAMALTDVLRRGGMRVGEAAGLCVVTNITQPLLALAAFALSPVLGEFLPIALGFSAGSLVFLVLTELLPSSYERAGRGLVATLVTVTAGAVVLLEHFFV